jgi:UDP-N-acetylglucosamine 2-epimerase (non-hydrolysing)
MRVLLVAGARPNFMKVAPVLAALRAAGDEAVLVHTGQHYDARMSDAFFQDLALPEPDFHLGVGSGSHAAQTARVMEAFEPVVREVKADWVVVVGDVNSTLACALVAAKLREEVGSRIAHVEAGLRSRDWRMPEEINRVLTDRLSDLLLIPSIDAIANLRAEGIPEERIAFVGNVMIDTLLGQLPAARSTGAVKRLGLDKGKYVVVTLHRPSNVDSDEQLRSVVYALQSLADHTDVVFPAQPRVFQRLKDTNLWSDMDRHGRLRVINPLGYLEFLGLVDLAGAILTDSGGVQEEAVMLGVPCVTLRSHTDRPVTLLHGANRLAGNDPHLAVRYVCEALHARSGMAPIPEGWDGHAAGRIVDVLERVLTDGSDDRF